MSMFLHESLFHKNIFKIYKAARSKYQYHQKLCILTAVDVKQNKYSELSDDQFPYVYFSTFEFQ